MVVNEVDEGQGDLKGEPARQLRMGMELRDICLTLADPMCLFQRLSHACDSSALNSETANGSIHQL